MNSNWKVLSRTGLDGECSCSCMRGLNISPIHSSIIHVMTNDDSDSDDDDDDNEQEGKVDIN
ncbi:unnamed protein product [Schistosoma mattheei]|uniref:Uncharacterized protein n=1 Tax=Schistosoma mattheei TaxID=31246 RepID=A0A183NK05_9TREM|nr:unnamed protein product [Schistosoma mattheei]